MGAKGKAGISGYPCLSLEQALRLSLTCGWGSSALRDHLVGRALSPSARISYDTSRVLSHRSTKCGKAVLLFSSNEKLKRSMDLGHLK
jgi:hypothetical protein